MKRIMLMTIKIIALPGEILPAGISRFLVRGLRASMSRSSQRLKPIAVFLANTMHSTTSKSSSQLKPPAALMPRKNPISANGIANTVCANRIIEKYFLTFSSIVFYSLSSSSYTSTFLLSSAFLLLIMWRKPISLSFRNLQRPRERPFLSRPANIMRSSFTTS